MLTVIQPFGDYAAGDTISDPKKVKLILASDQAAFVVSTGEPQPEPETPAA